MAILDLFKSDSERKFEEEMDKKAAELKATRAVKKQAAQVQKLMKECAELEAEAKQLLRSGNKANQVQINYCAKLYKDNMNKIAQLQQSLLSNKHAISSIEVVRSVEATNEAISDFIKVAAPNIMDIRRNQQTIIRSTASMQGVNDLITEGYDIAVESIEENTAETETGNDSLIGLWTADVANELGGAATTTVPNSTAASADPVDNSLEARIARFNANNE